MSERYITDRFLPDKAIDLIDEACSDVNLKDKNIVRRAELRKDLDDLKFERETLHERRCRPKVRNLRMKHLINATSA